MAESVAEFDLIARIRTRAAAWAGPRDDVLLGIGDDAAILRVPDGHDLVVSTDTLNVGVHFPSHTTPFDIGWKALAVNLSDLAAMGATPAWCTLNLTLPESDAAWLGAFLDGFVELAARHRIALVGGDTTRGPLSITVTVHGVVPRGAALRRDGAQIGDEVWVSGTLGDAAAGLTRSSPSPDGRGVGVRGDSPSGPGVDDHLRSRLHRPTPRIALGLALHAIASACIDVSDGLLADLAHIGEESSVGALLDVEALPTSRELVAAFDEITRRRLQLGGGDDYELCFTAPPDRAEAVLAAAKSVRAQVTRIGRIEAQLGLRLREADGRIVDAPVLGYRHFDAGDAGDAPA
ncbi:MAG: thiamine-phosphate kinase [Proteobacteria bacterium]|nr:thiamine-phosphate kinase [Pseudomonadota bacterium]MBS0461995.1 thiamine-phosphate kinase [Pseudomonadota bacterium]MBS0464761.1 thiamine-phosphate kinase [Pseudomonadota bacterium]